ncbi:MAG: carbohydrate ABC transporter permease [Acholeplasmataceae bacterium]
MVEQRTLKTKQSFLTSPYLLLVPALLFYLLFWFFPVMLSFIQSFTAKAGGFSLDNYRMMFADSLFNRALVNTLVFAIVSLFLQFVIALLVALLVNRNFKGSQIFLFIMLIPMALPQSAVGILWNTGLMQTGWINSLLESTGLQAGLEGLGILDGRFIWKGVSGMEAVFLVILIDTWTVMPSVMIIILAGLQNFNKEYKEAAQVFGATRFQALKDIVIPIIKPSIVTALLLRLIAGVQVWLISVMIFGFERVPFLLERIVYYSDRVRTGEFSYQIAVSYSVFTLAVVFLLAFGFVRLTKSKDWRGA